MLWRAGLLAKLKKIGINGRMFAFIKDFITDRIFQVQIGNERSSTRTLENGTPQGSVISPILFLIMINDMSAVINVAHLSLFADDSTCYVQVCRKKPAIYHERNSKKREPNTKLVRDVGL